MLVLYIFAPSATLVFLMMGIVAIPKEAIAAARLFLSDHILPYRIILIAGTAACCYVSETFKGVAYCWLLLCIPGAIAFAVWRNLLNDPGQLRLMFAFKATLYVWRGFR